MNIDGWIFPLCCVFLYLQEGALDVLKELKDFNMTVKLLQV